MEISVEKLMELYIDTLQKCGVNLLSMEDSEIEYNIFEEFDINATSFLHENSLVKLKQAGFIDEKALQMSSNLLSMFMELRDTDYWNVSAIKYSDKWRKIMDLSDEIKLYLKVSTN